ncbi:3-dehydroquinate synthase [Mesonia maritima]|uniref:3-dehydroquinate synthase n=1 Tax=Mesonia maritima TaxID=1793873 RepID=A0ABU1KA47_9FLAO|nr:3-dehydroquinate synthase [Mesonia maritima]MDR6302166.1 3-dehydroquinate synthase [Mesonia maritima]
MKSLTSVNNFIHFGQENYVTLNVVIEEINPSKIFILTDSNTQEHCLAFFLQFISTSIAIEVIEIEPGEEHKNIETCQGVWKTLTEFNADRKALFINLGGGVVTDLGGFVASTFKRGIKFINIPTSLLAMVDASVGGKTGVDLGNLKNQIGVFQDPVVTLIDVSYLATLPQNHLKSGLAEMLKHGLICDENYWEKLSDLSQLNLTDLEKLIYHSVEIKTSVVEEDQHENGNRKILNFGHTLGHAIESYSLNSEERETLLHGEAIAIGLILESYLSSKILNLPEDKAEEIKSVILQTFKKVDFTSKEIQSICELLVFDKKNSHGNVNFVLLHQIGTPQIDCKVSEKLIYEAFEFYKN